MHTAAGGNPGNSVVSQNAAAAAAAAVAAAATSQANYLSGNHAAAVAANGQAVGQNAAAAAAAAAAALNNPSAAAAAAALLPCNQVGVAPRYKPSLFQSPAKGATIPYRPSPSSTPTCICNSSSTSSISSCEQSTGSVAAAVVSHSGVQGSIPSSQQQQQQPQVIMENNQQYSKQLLLQMPPPPPAIPVQPQQQPGFLPASAGHIQNMPAANNNLFLPCMDDMTAAMYGPQPPMIYMPGGPGGGVPTESYLYPPMDPFQIPPTPDLKDTSLASPSSTSSSSCSSYSMLMVPQQPPQPPPASHMAFYSPAASPAIEVRSEGEQLTTKKLTMEYFSIKPYALFPFHSGTVSNKIMLIVLKILDSRN